MGATRRLGLTLALCAAAAFAVGGGACFFSLDDVADADGGLDTGVLDTSGETTTVPDARADAPADVRGDTTTCPATASTVPFTATAACTNIGGNPLNGTSAVRIGETGGPASCLATLTPPPSPSNGTLCATVDAGGAGACGATTNGCVRR